MSDEQDPSAEDVLDWLCWVWASDGDRFYPPGETAQGCVEGLDEAGNEKKLAREEGYHIRAYVGAVDRFEALEARGFDPVARAERHIEDAQERELDLPDIDWSWWEASKNSGESDTNTSSESPNHPETDDSR
jgi:hypothetical protein